VRQVESRRARAVIVGEVELRLEPDMVPRATAQALRWVSEHMAREGITARLTVDEPPDGSKAGTGAQLAAVVLSGLVSATGLSAASQILVALIRRPEIRRVELRRGDELLILDGASPADQRAVVEAWLSVNSGAAPTQQDDTSSAVTATEAP
jgi:hypothetical protein